MTTRWFPVSRLENRPSKPQRKEPEAQKRPSRGLPRRSNGMRNQSHVHTYRVLPQARTQIQMRARSAASRRCRVAALHSFVNQNRSTQSGCITKSKPARGRTRDHMTHTPCRVNPWRLYRKYGTRLGRIGSSRWLAGPTDGYTQRAFAAQRGVTSSRIGDQV
jgi:hypothetical protein